MADNVPAELYFVKADERLIGAESEFANGRYSNCANRCSSACDQAAIAALLREHIGPRGSQWGHEYVQVQCVNQLINRRPRYPPSLRTVLAQNQELRHTADYEPEHVTETRATRALRRSRDFVDTIRRGGGS